MKLKQSVVVFAAGMTLSWNAMAQAFKVIPDNPKVQDTVLLVYDARKTPLKEPTTLSA